MNEPPLRAAGHGRRPVAKGADGWDPLRSDEGRARERDGHARHPRREGTLRDGREGRDRSLRSHVRPSAVVTSALATTIYGKEIDSVPLYPFNPAATAWSD